MIEVNPLIHQYNFISSYATHTALIAGFGSGKTHGGVLKTILRHLEYQVDVAYYLPTYPLIRDIAFGKFSEILDEMKIPYELNRTDKEFRTKYGRIILRSMDNPDLIVGYEVGYSLIDEADILAMQKMYDVYIKVLGRNRSNPVKNCLDFVSTPEGFKFMYDFFVSNTKEDRVLIKGKTTDNPYLPPDYVENLKQNYSANQLKAYLEGEFVNLTSGTVYYEYERDIHDTVRQVNSGDIIHVGCDFNVTNMHAVAFVNDNGINHAVDEFVGLFDTFSLREQLRHTYPNHKINVYPDAAGGARKTSGKSDHDLLREYGFNVITRSKNPFVKDRVNEVNKSFRDKTAFVNKTRCPKLAEALERQPYKNGEPDKTSGFDHINEAFGYYIYNQGKTIKISSGGSSMR